MRFLLCTLIFLCLAFNAQAQAPGKFKYQAVARDANNLPYANTALRIRFSFLETNANGPVRYAEEHNVTTSALGVFDATIGAGAVLQGSLNNVLWGENAYYLRVELNTQPTGGNFIVMGTSQLLSVPYAIYSAQAGSGGDQTLDISGNELSISNGNTVQLPEYQAGLGITISGQTISAKDDSDTNELQYLDISGHELILSNGNSVILPDDSFTLPYAGIGSDPSPLFSVTNTGSGAAIHAVTYGGGDAAIVGEDPSGGLAGVRGYSSGSYGVLGYSDNGEGVLGQSGSGTGVRGESNGGAGVYARGNPAVHAQGEVAVDANGGYGLNVYGGGEFALITDYGFETAVMANADHIGVVGQSHDYGGYFSGTSTAGVLAFSNGGGYAGNFAFGPTYCQTLQKGSGTFKIDHPLDPANKYLYHSFVESPDMMNVYNGNVVTDAEGRATVQLPEYFEALNKDFRYQLTCIGTFAQVIVEREVSGNSFIIRSDKPNVKVSWQVTGIRQDGHANKFRVIPEVEKEPENKGKYLCPDCFGQPEQKGIWYEEMHQFDKKNAELKAQK